MLFWVFIAVVAVQCGYALYFFLPALRPHNDKPLIQKQVVKNPVSIIICAKNEGHKLRKYLPAILAQKYGEGMPLYEVVVVNDGSDDDTAAVLEELKLRYTHLRHIYLPAAGERTLKGKKHALNAGVAHAAHPWLLLTDADCSPASDAWLQYMVAPLAQGSEIVVGYGGYNRVGGLLNAFIRWETLHTWLQYSSYAHAGQPYMGVGRNMACTKKAMLQAQNSDMWNLLPSGDDDMLVRIAGTANNVAVVGDNAAHTYTNAKATWGEWMRQKQRHLSTGKYYRQHIKLLLGGYALSHALVWGLFVVMLIMDCWPWVVVAAMAARCAVYWALWAATAAKLEEKKLIWLLPVMDIGWLVYNFAFLPYITWKNKKQWT